jgi:hypothetical protein
VLKKGAYTTQVLTSPPEAWLQDGHLCTVSAPTYIQWTLRYQDELISVAHSDDLVAAAGRSWLVFGDPRERGSSAGSLLCHPHFDPEGLRSLKLNGHILSCGGSLLIMLPGSLLLLYALVTPHQSESLTFLLYLLDSTWHGMVDGIDASRRAGDQEG